MTIEQERKELRKALQEKNLIPFRNGSEIPDLDLKIHHKRRVHTDYYDYEEWKIEYTVENQESMPIPAGQRISAYLLIPRQQGQKAPFPAMLCFHQCNVDCPLGKESVVGKVSYRPDQAYGLELVAEGFVVLAPDSINCGERFIPSIRQEGEGKSCHAVINDALGRDSWSKHHHDNIGSVDLLCSLQFVDAERIGAVGHSMGSGDAQDIILLDDRVKACILSGLAPNRFLPLHSPRLHLALQGALDGPPAKIEQIKAAYEDARRFYQADGAAENLVLRIHQCGHHFLDDFKWEAYSRLKQYFKIDTDKISVPLDRILKAAREQCSWAWANNEQFPEIKLSQRPTIIANEMRLSGAFAALFIYLFAKWPSVPLVLKTQENQSSITIRCILDWPRPQENASAKVPQENFMRRAQQLFVENGAAMIEEAKSDAMQYTITLPINN
ncbi:MAG: hypothetical protein GKR89_10405 [Candidatus Latescibacteria bacterium]|nr:hypothetical protein [Candidatus Latescibacterota bacterium]